MPKRFTDIPRFELEQKLRSINPTLRLALIEGRESSKLYFLRKNNKWRKVNPEALQRLPLTKEAAAQRVAHLQKLLRAEQGMQALIDLYRETVRAKTMNDAHRAIDRGKERYLEITSSLNELIHAGVDSLQKVAELENQQITIPEKGLAMSQVVQRRQQQAQIRASLKRQGIKTITSDPNVVIIPGEEGMVRNVATTAGALQRLSRERVEQLEVALQKIKKELAPARRELYLLTKPNSYAGLYAFYDLAQRKGIKIFD